MEEIASLADGFGFELIAPGSRGVCPRWHAEAALHALTKEFFTNARFDPIADRLVDTSPAPTALYNVMPAPCISSNPAEAKAITDYRAALAAARPPEPARPKPTVPAGPSRPARPGFA